MAGLGSIKANILGSVTEWNVVAWGAGPCIPGSSQGPYFQGWRSHPVSLYSAQLLVCPKCLRKDSQKSRGAQPGPSLMQGCKLPPALSPHVDWCPQIKDSAGHWNRKAKRSVPFFLLSLIPWSGTCFCLQDLMDHSVFIADLRDEERVWQWKGTRSWDECGTSNSLFPESKILLSQRFHETLTVLKSSSLELNNGVSCVSLWIIKTTEL